MCPGDGCESEPYWARFQVATYERQAQTSSTWVPFTNVKKQTPGSLVLASRKNRPPGPQQNEWCSDQMTHHCIGIQGFLKPLLFSARAQKAHTGVAKSGTVTLTSGPGCVYPNFVNRHRRPSSQSKGRGRPLQGVAWIDSKLLAVGG